MLTLLKDLQCYSPEYLGKKDILIACDKIYKIKDNIKSNELIDKIIPCDGLLAFPGIIDQHVHIIGGGGENGPASRITEIELSDIISAGVTSLVGVLGADSSTRSLKNLLAKAKALNELGITTYIYTGSYALPAVTLTDSVTNDLVLIDKVIGTKTAISDHRSSSPLTIELTKLAAETHIGGMLGNKAGVLHIHVGEGKQGLSPLLEVLDKTDLPIEQFVPTHVNRTEKLFAEAENYCKNGGNIDLTAGEGIGINVPDALKALIDSGINMSNVTVSSDSNGSIPNGGVGKIKTLYDDIKNCIALKNIPPETAFSAVTKNVAKVLKLYPQKGTLAEGSDADILITDKNYSIQKLISLGKLIFNWRQINEG